MYDVFKNLFKGYKVHLKKETQQKFRCYLKDKKSFFKILQEELDEQLYRKATDADRHDVISGQKILQEYFMQGLLFGIALGTECYKETSDSSALYKIYSGQTKEYCSGNIQNNESLAESRTYEDLSSALAQQLSDQQFNTFLMINDINHMIVYALHQEYFADGIKQGMLLGSEAIGLISLM